MCLELERCAAILRLFHAYNDERNYPTVTKENYTIILKTINVPYAPTLH